MSYTPHAWTEDETISPARLNILEQGIASVNSGLDAIIWFVDSTQGWQVEGDFTNALAKIQNGKPIFCIYYDTSVADNTGVAFSELSFFLTICYDTSHPNRIDLRISSAGDGFYWTANGVEYYD